MKEIQLTQGKVTLVSDEDYEYLNQFKWSAVKGRRDTWYAKRNCNGKTLMMHREILGLTDKKTQGDHRDHDGLNNQRSNLRVTTDSQNKMNRRSATNSSSQYLGVCFHKYHKKYISSIRLNKKNYFLGYFEKPEDAAIAYDVAARKYFGEFANPNFKSQ